MVEDHHAVEDGPSRALGIVGHAEPEGLDPGPVGGVGQRLVLPVDDEARLRLYGGVGERLDHDFRADSGGIAHRDADHGGAVAGLVGPGMRHGQS